MKKLIAILLICVMIVCATACKNKNGAETTTAGSTNAQQQTTNETKPENSTPPQNEQPTNPDTPPSDTDNVIPSAPTTGPTTDQDNDKDDIKLDLNNGGTTSTPQPDKTPDSGNADGIIDFDKLLEVTNQ